MTAPITATRGPASGVAILRDQMTVRRLRLACQLRPRHDISVLPLLPRREAPLAVRTIGAMAEIG